MYINIYHSLSIPAHAFSLIGLTNIMHKNILRNHSVCSTHVDYVACVISLKIRNGSEKSPSDCHTKQPKEHVPKGV